MALNINAQQLQFSEYSYKPDKQYFKSYLDASKRIVISPARWDKRQWIAAGSVVVGGILVYSFDSEIRDLFQRNRNNTTDQVGKYIEPFGSIFCPVLLAGGFYIYGLATRDNSTRQIALGATQAFVLSALTVQIIKHLSHRHSPYQDIPANPRLWEGPFKGFEYTSFPSGHTITAFSMAAFFSSVYKDRLWVGIMSYGLASAVAFQRLSADEHWASDVLVGAALGFAIGKSVYHIMGSNSRLTMGFSNTGGIAFVYHIK